MHQAILLHSSDPAFFLVLEDNIFPGQELEQMLLRAGAERSKEAAEQERMLKAIELGDLRGEMEELIKGS